MDNELFKKWQDDCERLTQPHLQWQKRNSEFGHGEWRNCYGDEEVLHRIRQGLEIMRIESLALPFDLQDANNGGKVVCYHGVPAKWKNCKFHRLESGLAFVGTNQDGKFFISLGNLRMKESRLKTTGAANG